MIEANVIEAACQAGVAKLVVLGSLYIYPKMASQPIDEDALLTQLLEPTNEWYAAAKIARIKLWQAYRQQYGCDFISTQLTNVYGPFDNFDLTCSYVLAALIRKAHEAKAAGARDLTICGIGMPLRELLHVDDLVDARALLATRYSGEDIVNIGSGMGIAIGDLMQMVARIVGFEGPVVTDPSKPDGTPRNLLDTKRLEQLGWRASIGLEQGITST